jgi:hypothetical protein
MTDQVPVILPGQNLATDTSRALKRYVISREIKAASAGRERELLQKIGIECEHNKKRRCPYHDHGGENDWSWDDGLKLAICTCIGKRALERGKKAHDIFRVVQVLENRDFDSAKLRIAELLGRHDLVRTKHDKGSGQKFDAAALMWPSPDQRDDSLVPKYLGFRLNVSPDEVLLPTTTAVGWTDLPYFDDVSRETIASPPCVVFEQIDPDHKTHAHRIYLAENGKGKAELGLGPDGSSRDPKKSAVKAKKEDRTAGRAVIWGQYHTAPLAVLTEGIETAAAVAHAFRSEIEAAELYVAACISAAGVSAFRPWPATRRVIVAADRDEGVNEAEKQRGRAGEHAAREFCLRALRHD